MNINIEIEIHANNNKKCISILEAIEPDNYILPQGIFISMKCLNEVLVIRIESNNAHILTFRNTVDDLLEHITITLKTLTVFNSDKK